MGDLMTRVNRLEVEHEAMTAFIARTLGVPLEGVHELVAAANTEAERAGVAAAHGGAGAGAGGGSGGSEGRGSAGKP